MGEKPTYLKHRKIHTMGLFFYLISWFIYFARAMTAVMDIHVHGISPMTRCPLFGKSMWRFRWPHRQRAPLVGRDIPLVSECSPHKCTSDLMSTLMWVLHE